MKHSNLERLHSMRSSFKVWKRMKTTQNFVIKKNRRYNLRFNLTFKVCKFTMSMAWIKFIFEILDLYVVSISSRLVLFVKLIHAYKKTKSNITELQCFWSLSWNDLFSENLFQFTKCGRGCGIVGKNRWGTDRAKSLPTFGKKCCTRFSGSSPQLPAMPTRTRKGP